LRESITFAPNFAQFVQTLLYEKENGEPDEKNGYPLLYNNKTT